MVTQLDIEKIELKNVFEYCLDDDLNAKIADLLDICFPDTFGGRSYYKQLPDARLLMFYGDKLIGQLGFDTRIINVSGRIMKIFGVIDLCILPNFRNNGLGRHLLSNAESLGNKSDFIVLMADRHDLYLQCGYRTLQEATTKWLAIEDRESVSVIERDLSDCFLYKNAHCHDNWPKGHIDLLRYLF